MLNIHITPANQQAVQALRVVDKQTTSEEASLHAGSFDYLSWAYVTEDVYYPVHRHGGFDCYIYELSQSHLMGDKIELAQHMHEGDMLVMQSGSSNIPVVKKVGPGFSAFEFWFTESGVLNGTEKADYMKFNSNQFPVSIDNDVVVRQLFGNEAPIVHINGLKIIELIIPPGATYVYSLDEGRKMGIYVIKGVGACNEQNFFKGDFMEISHTDQFVKMVHLKSVAESSTQLIVIDILA